MSSSVSVTWSDSLRPTREEVGAALEDYVRGLATEVVWERDRYFVTLPGTKSWTFQRVGPATESMRAAWLESGRGECGEPSERWFEVWVGKKYLEVLTRRADDVTSAVARNFAALCARGWRGELSE